MPDRSTLDRPSANVRQPRGRRLGLVRVQRIEIRRRGLRTWTHAGDDGTRRWIGIDLGSRTGVAIFDPYRGQARCIETRAWDFRPRRGESAGIRPLTFRTYLQDLLSLAAGPVAIVGYEIVHAHAGTYAAQVYGQLQGILMTECEARGIDYKAIPVGTAKFAATGSGAARKPVVAKCMVALARAHCSRIRLGAKLTEDETDALAVLLALRLGL